MDDIAFKGYWWLPGREEHRLAGDLSFSQENGVRLELFGDFLFGEKFPGSELKLILGEVDGGKKVTLQECWCTNHNGHVKNSFSKYLVNLIFLNIHAETESQLSFRQTELSFSYLSEWAATSGMRTARNTDPRTLLQYEHPDDISVNAGVAKILISFGLSSEFRRGRSLFEESVSIFIEVPEEMPVDDLLDLYIIPFRDFLNLGTGQANFIQNLYFLPSSESRQPVQVFYKQRSFAGKKDFVHPSNMLFSLPDIRERIGDMVNRWLLVSKELDIVMKHFAIERTASDLFLDLRFLTIAKALEKYHRDRFLSELIPKLIHRHVKKKLVKRAPSQHRWWLKDALGYSNEKKLRTRLKELLDGREPVFLPIMGDLDKYIAKIVYTRNYFTHYGGNLREKALDGFPLLIATELLSMALQSCLLSEIGISIEEQCGMFAKNGQYSWLREHANVLKDVL